MNKQINDGKNPILELKNVNKSFGGVVTAKNVSLCLYPGEILGLIGPNGAGKTTMLNLVSGIDAVNSGTILFDGKVITKMPPYDRAHLGLARTFQTPRFLQRSSLLDNMLLGKDLAENAKFGKSFFQKKTGDIKTEVEELTKIIDFQINWDDDILSIPYGNRKLLEIIRALLTHPKVMLVDEPAAGLNNKEIEKAISLLEYAAYKKNIAIILIEHVMDMVTNICERIVILNFGEIIAQGKPEEVFTIPAVKEAYLGGDTDA
jgi:ABC-type branched-subunit amino acid transport system ATPase component